MQIHVVQAGQTLDRIARQYGVRADAIASTNQLSPSQPLVPGQSLVIPSDPGTYVVQPGDSLWTIARQYGTTPQELIRLNMITQPSVLDVGTKLRVPKAQKKTIEVNGYFTDFGATGASVVQAHAAQLTYIAAFSHHVTATGDIQTIDDAPLLQAAKTANVAPLLVIANYAGSMFSPSLAHTVLSDNTVNQHLIDNVLEQMQSKGYRGLNIDFEYVNPSDRQLYNAFLRKVSDQLHAKGYLVSTALAPKTSATQKGQLYEAHDYPVHGALCDFVVLMTYEWGWAGGPPMTTNLLHVFKRFLVVMESSGSSPVSVYWCTFSNVFGFWVGCGIPYLPETRTRHA